METATRWYHYTACFFGGAFLANTIPHLVSGISGSLFQPWFRSGLNDHRIRRIPGSLSGVFSCCFIII